MISAHSQLQRLECRAVHIQHAKEVGVIALYPIHEVELEVAKGWQAHIRSCVVEEERPVPVRHGLASGEAEGREGRERGEERWLNELRQGYLLILFFATDQR
jgi:hypothetical protein